MAPVHPPIGSIVAVIGGGIVGLASAYKLLTTRPGTSLVLIEKEANVAGHQTGHNSGVLHSGIYYKPGSLKAKTSTEGRAKMVAFCEEHGINYDICSKVIVATQDIDLPRLAVLEERAAANGVEARRIDVAELREREPHAAESRRCTSLRPGSPTTRRSVGSWPI
ncbi:MAG: FAD-dependent oxidoreductase [Acidimicrobiales bacterium]